MPAGAYRKRISPAVRFAPDFAIVTRGRAAPGDALRAVRPFWRAGLIFGITYSALLSAFATYAAGFLVRPFGAIVFGWPGSTRKL